MTIAPPLHATPSAHHRFHLLDALRGVAAVVVVYWHVPIPFRLRANHSGFLAVDFFFCLSGFVLAFAYERRLESTVRLREFMTARLIRLYPIYLLALSLGLCLVLLSAAHSSSTLIMWKWLASFFFFQLFMIPSVITGISRFLFPLDFPAWSIFFELAANAAYAALVRTRHASTQTLTIIFALAATAMLVYAATGHGIDAGATWARSIVVGPLRVVLSFLSGVLVLRFVRSRNALPWTAPKSLLVATVMTLCLVLLLLAPFTFLQSRIFSVFTIAVLFPSVVYLSALCRLPAALATPCAFLGDISYPVYLLHAHFLTLLQAPLVLRLAHRYPGMKLLFVPAFLLLTGGASYLTLKLYDSPVRSYLQRTYNAHRLERS